MTKLGVRGLHRCQKHDDEEHDIHEGEDDQTDAVGDFGDGAPLSDYQMIEVLPRSRQSAAHVRLVEDVEQDLEYVLEHEKFHGRRRRLLRREHLINSRSVSLVTHKAPVFTSNKPYLYKYCSMKH